MPTKESFLNCTRENPHHTKERKKKLKYEPHTTTELHVDCIVWFYDNCFKNSKPHQLFLMTFIIIICWRKDSWLFPSRIPPFILTSTCMVSNQPLDVLVFLLLILHKEKALKRNLLGCIFAGTVNINIKEVLTPSKKAVHFLQDSQIQLNVVERIFNSSSWKPFMNFSCYSTPILAVWSDIATDLQPTSAPQTQPLTI